MSCETQQLADACLQEAIAQDLERRRLHRKPFLRRATLVGQGTSNESTPAFCRDLSRDGIGLLHSMALEPDAPFTLYIPLLGQQLQLHCCTSWCEHVDENCYFSGSVYDTISTPGTLLLLSAVLSDDLHRRLHRRYPLVRPARLESINGAPCDAFCRDVSQSGMGFISRSPIEPGTYTASIKLAGHGTISGDVELRRCDAIGQGWFCSGGRFSLPLGVNCTLSMAANEPSDP